MNRSRTILLVEDSDDDVELTLRAFRKCSTESVVDVARDGEAALQYLLRTGPYANDPSWHLPDLVLLDLKLPKIDGHEVLRRLRSNEATRRLPVVVLTSSSELEDVNASYEYGANSYIRKPVNSSEFAEAARLIGLYWLVLNEPGHQLER